MRIVELTPSSSLSTMTVLAALFSVSSPCSAQSAVTGALPSIRILATGGTIAARGSSPTDLSNYKAGSLLGEDIVNAVPQIKEVANVTVEQVFNVNSADMTLDNLLTIANRIDRIFASDPSVAGIVVTHGTATLEETAYFLNLTVKSDRPVVVVGSMRPATAISADGPLNLLNAVRTASSHEARDKGVLIVMNGEINGARDTTKTITNRVETFRAPELGLLGYVDEDKVSFYRASTRRHTIHSEFDLGVVTALPRVDIAYSYLEPSGSAIQALVSSGAKGIVFAGLGAGALSDAEKSGLKTAFSQMTGPKPVLVRSSRVGNGRIYTRDEYDAMGMVPADTLNPQKARILLMLALTKTSDLGEIRRIFSEY